MENPKKKKKNVEVIGDRIIINDDSPADKKKDLNILEIRRPDRSPKQYKLIKTAKGGCLLNAV